MNEQSELISSQPPQPTSAEASPAVEKSIKIIGAAESRASEDHPERNEDAHFFNVKRGEAAVCDGVGGEEKGEKPSKKAIETIQDELSKILEDATLEETEKAVRKAILSAGKAITEGDTTASVVKIWKGPKGEVKAIIGNAGNSRVSIRKKDGTLIQITEDDNLLKLNRLAGKITPEQQKAIADKLDNVTNLSTLTPDEQEYFDNRAVVFNSLASEGLNPNITTIDLEEGDILILESDGSTDNQTKNQRMQNARYENPDDIVRSMVDTGYNIASKGTAANPRAKKDDITVVALRVGETPPSTPKEAAPVPTPDKQPSTKGVEIEAPPSPAEQYLIDQAIALTEEISRIKEAIAKGETIADPREPFEAYEDKIVEKDRVKRAIEKLNNNEAEEAKELVKAYYQEKILFQSVLQQRLKETQTVEAPQQIQSTQQLEAKAEEKEASTKAAEDIEHTKNILTQLGVSEAEIQTIKNLAQAQQQEQVKQLIEAQRSLGRNNIADIIQEAFIENNPEAQEKLQKLAERAAETAEAQPAGAQQTAEEFRQQIAEMQKELDLLKKQSEQAADQQEKEQQPKTKREKVLAAAKIGGIIGLMLLIAMVSAAKQ